MVKVYQRAAARRDLIAHFVHLAENAGLDTAERFLKNAQASFDDLAGRPMMGTPMKPRNAALGGMRKWRIKGFDKHLIFYLPRPDGISVVRVLHGARAWWTLLGVDTQ
ncbi:type II toxin-antitoxin system RelE/ParE family toxin [uncultured Thiodictyon sp.]|uniref:type II toxin-antitoxin system RelE/ParE family toxin n=1 Tax=uncultured Thiodictyon sp. TaxID=1846217 RepID=UPI0025FD4023|nr:type II toxin-antitoxin system RelE/ParE family toxin [uncultured Thiodictyon sp.]